MVFFILAMLGTVIAVAGGARLSVAAAWSAVACFIATFLSVNGGGLARGRIRDSLKNSKLTASFRL